MLGVAHDLGRHRGLAAQRATELTDEAFDAPVKMDVLARERRASTVGATVPVGLQSADAPTEQDALELLDMTGTGGHGLKDSPSPARLLPA